MKNLICYLSLICMLMPACSKKPSYHIPQHCEESDSGVSNPIVPNENETSVPPQKSNVSVTKKELANKYGWIVYIDGTFNPNDSCYSDFKLYIENKQTQEQRTIMECKNGENAYLPIKGEDRSYKTFEKIKEVLLSSNRMFIYEGGMRGQAVIVDIESLSILKEIYPFDEFTGYKKWEGLEFKIIDDGTMENTRIFTQRYNFEGELVYEDETIIKYDNPNPVIPKETNTLSSKIKEYTSNLPINAEKITEGYDWIVYKQQIPDAAGEWCDAVRLYIENINSHKLYFLLESSCDYQKGTGIDVLNKETNKYEYQSEFFWGYWDDNEIEVLSPSRILIGISDARHINCSIIDLETFSVVYIGAFRWGLSVTHENGHTYLDYSSCNQYLGKYQFWSSRYDIYGNLLHEEVTTILYPPDYQMEGDCM